MMKKTTKRILALLMTVTALLGLMVPAVSADEAATEVKEVSYNFDTETVFAAIEASSSDFAPTASGNYYYLDANAKMPDAINKAFDEGKLTGELVCIMVRCFQAIPLTSVQIILKVCVSACKMMQQIIIRGLAVGFLFRLQHRLQVLIMLL